ncbi:MAG: 50S ribosomal protein L24 [Candidatus Hepatoplasma scabrum]|nr:MAG: 50S ribosomal protein L24 [Candidatus Hepatoplasma sp.]
MKLKKGDRVIVISGKDKGKSGLIKEVFAKTNKVIVEDVNVRTFHVKPSQKDQEGGIFKKEAPIDVSNVMYDIGTKKEAKGTRIGYKYVTSRGKKTKKRIAKKTGDEI